MKTQLTFVVGSLLMLVLPAAAEPTPLAAVNSPATEQDPWLSPDGYTLFFASNREGGDSDIYQSQWNGREWSQPQALGSHVNSEFDDSQPSVSDDGRRLLFVSHRGRFYRGVWMCQRQPDGSLPCSPDSSAVASSRARTTSSSRVSTLSGVRLSSHHGSSGVARGTMAILGQRR